MPCTVYNWWSPCPVFNKWYSLTHMPAFLVLNLMLPCTPNYGWYFCPISYGWYSCPYILRVVVFLPCIQWVVFLPCIQWMVFIPLQWVCLSCIQWAVFLPCIQWVVFLPCINGWYSCPLSNGWYSCPLSSGWYSWPVYLMGSFAALYLAARSVSCSVLSQYSCSVSTENIQGLYRQWCNMPAQYLMNSICALYLTGGIPGLYPWTK